MSASEQPIVSVLTLCYNNGRLVVDGLESARTQTYRNIQHLIADDCSQDDSVRIIENWIRQHNYNCTFIRRPKNIGICKGLNELLKLATGKYVAFVSDDVWLPNHLTTAVSTMESQPDTVGAIYSDAYESDEHGKLSPKLLIAANHKFIEMPQGHINNRLWEGNFIPALTVLVRRKCFDKVGGYDEDLVYEDWDMWLRISEHYQFVFSPIPCAIYRVLPTSMMQSRKEDIQESTDRILVNGLASGKLPVPVRQVALSKLQHRALYSYRTRSKNARFYLANAVRFHQGKAFLCMYCLSMLGVSHRIYAQIEKVWRFYRSIIRNVL